MVKGLRKFRDYFSHYAEQYLIIGGTACDIILNNAGFIPRTTKDIDIVLIVEALDSSFVKKFWDFVREANYDSHQKGVHSKKYYRFTNPENEDFPYQIELFSRNPDLKLFSAESHLTPIPVDEDLSSLSAILLNSEYYKFVIKNCAVIEEINCATKQSLICLKAKAFLEILERLERGSTEDRKKLKKHQNDVFRLALLLTDEDIFALPDEIKFDLQLFVDYCKINSPDANLFKSMGVSGITVEAVLAQLIKCFDLRNNSHYNT
ncbi:MAG: hypothetical protein PHE56_03305 [Bacteroidales bacterium]|nr:hypothetical protein [Bacteroidales bacterium]